VLARAEHGHALRELGILYAPDYVINAGGLINVCDELGGYSAERARAGVEGIFGKLRMVFHRAKEQGIPTSEAADRFAEERMREVSRIKLIRVEPAPR
jgi:leucine dehydrogenase